MRRRLLLALLPVGWVLTAAPSCLSPTLPLPPPDVPTDIAEAQSADTWTVDGACLVGARVTVLNEATGLGAVYEDRAKAGTYSVTIHGKLCDPAVVYQQLGDVVSDDSSGAATFILAPHSPSSPTFDPTCPLNP